MFMDQSIFAFWAFSFSKIIRMIFVLIKYAPYLNEFDNQIDAIP